MRTVKFDLVGDLKVERGSEWRRRTFAIEGDFTSWDIFGEIRKKAGGELYGAFNFEPMILITIPINGVATECTRIVPFLRASVVADRGQHIDRLFGLDWCHPKKPLLFARFFFCKDCLYLSISWWSALIGTSLVRR